jgi:hypothetical protein
MSLWLLKNLLPRRLFGPSLLLFLTHAFRIKDAIQPYCRFAVTTLNFLWGCPNFDDERIRNNLTTEILKDDPKEAMKLKKKGLYSPK